MLRVESAPLRKTILVTSNNNLNFYWILSLSIRVNTSFPEKRRSQEAWDTRSRGQERVQTQTSPWLAIFSSLNYHCGDSCCLSLSPRIPGSLKDYSQLRCLAHLAARLLLASIPIDLRIPQLSKICMINSPTWQRKGVPTSPVNMGNIFISHFSSSGF